jgi:hypothetical protein
LRNVGAASMWVAFQPFDANAGERNVIQLHGADYTSLVFEMAGRTFTDVGVESARLALQDGQIVGVANDAVLSLDALHRRVASGTFIFEKSMTL